jgi:DNA-binding beta-propeller fold protein YncE
MLTAIDLEAGIALGSAPVGRSPVTIDGPHQVVADVGKRVAYVVHAYPGALESAGNHSHGLSQRPGWVQALAMDDLRAVAEVRVDPNPGEIALSEDGRRLVVSHYDLKGLLTPDLPLESRRSTLTLVDPAAMLPFGTPEPVKLLVCVAPHGLALSRPDATTAFVACYGEDAVAKVDLGDTHVPVERVPVGPHPGSGAGTPNYGPYGLALSPDDSRLAIGTSEAKDVRFLDVKSNTMEALVLPAPGATYVPSWSRDGKKLYVPTRARDALTVFDAATGAVLVSRTFDPRGDDCIAPLECALGSDPSRVHLTCEGSATVPGSIVTLDAATLQTVARVPLGFFPGRAYVGRLP